MATPRLIMVNYPESVDVHSGWGRSGYFAIQRWLDINHTSYLIEMSQEMWTYFLSITNVGDTSDYLLKQKIN